jgi:hypothetical protein
MEKIVKLIILACLFLSCDKEYEIPKHCFKMTISNSLPVQFWLNGEETFNQKVVCGITPVCFCQPFQCDDEIKIQFTDNIDVDYYLNIFDSENNELKMQIFESVLIGSQYLYSLEFTANDYSLCGKQVTFKIVTVSLVDEGLSNYNFSGDIDTTFIDDTNWWQPNVGTVDEPDDLWIYDIVGPYANFIQRNHDNASQSIYATIRHLFEGGVIINNGDSIRITFRATVQTLGTGEDLVVTIWGIENGVSNIQHEIATFSVLAGVEEIVIDEDVIFPLIPIIDANFKGIQLAITGRETGGNVAYIDFFNIVLDNTIIYDGLVINEVIAESDCISFKESHSCTLLINYSNNSNVFGIQYADQSPSPSFDLRIPAIFFEEDNTKESEDHETSDNVIIRLYSKIEEKRKLRIGHMPHYMHRKIIMALSHDFVLIDGKDWISRDEYKKNEGDRHYPLKSAETLLTDKNFIKENQL